MKRKTRVMAVMLLLTCLAGLGLYSYGRSLWYPLLAILVGRRTVEDVVADYGDAAESRLVPRFQAAGVNYPPNELALIALKEERQLELWARSDGPWVFIHRYPIRAASGGAGPKLREGDRQVPEGLYQITDLNPNSSYHLSIKLNYPNQFDLQHAQSDQRTDPGSDIFIHGRAASVGCLAMGDPVIEELFVLVHKVGRENVHVLISPHDARQRSLLPVSDELPEWTDELYRMIEKEFGNYPDSVDHQSLNQAANGPG
jgi:hypothetical protein